MKKLFLFLLILGFGVVHLGAQVPQLIHYQAVPRDAQGNKLPEGQTVWFRFTILNGSPSGNIVYQESIGFSVPVFGIINHDIGSLSPQGGLFFSNIDWGAGSKYLKVESASGSSGPWTDMGATQLVSVPYALFAKEAGNAGVPPGTIVAWGGITAPEGWALCDGSALSKSDPDFAALFAAIGTNFGGTATHFNLPDFRGRFLRGVSGSSGLDPDASDRPAMNPGGLSGNIVGSVQLDATAKPENEFTTNSNGSHNHTGTTASNGSHYHYVAKSNSTSGTIQGDLGSTETLARYGNVGLPGQTLYNSNHEYDLQGISGTSADVGRTNSTGSHTHSFTTSSNGSHSHSITGGGDNETRPVNAYVNYIIKL